MFSLNASNLVSVMGSVWRMFMSYSWYSSSSARSGSGALESVSAMSSSLPGLYVTCMGYH